MFSFLTQHPSLLPHWAAVQATPTLSVHSLSCMDQLLSVACCKLFQIFQVIFIILSLRSMTVYSLFLSGNIVVESTIVNSNQISVTWTTPQSVIDQGISLYQIMITPVCLNGGATQTFTATPSDPSSITLSGLGKLKILHTLYSNFCLGGVFCKGNHWK